MVLAETALQVTERVRRGKKVVLTWRKTQRKPKRLAIVELFICYYSGELPSCRLSHDSLHEPLTYMITPPNLSLVIAFLIPVGYSTVD